jgi:hypothetical protein
VQTVWTGIASEFLGALAELAGERVAKGKSWPDSPRAPAGRIVHRCRKANVGNGFWDQSARTQTSGADAIPRPAQTAEATIRLSAHPLIIPLRTGRTVGTQIFIPFISQYRTMCLAPSADLRRVLEDLREFR